MIGTKTLLGVALSGVGGLTMATALALITDVSDAGAGMVAALAKTEAGPFAWGLLFLGFVVTLRTPMNELAGFLVRRFDELLGMVFRLLAILVAMAESRAEAWLEARDYRRVIENLDRSAAKREPHGTET